MTLRGALAGVESGVMDAKDVLIRFLTLSVNEGRLDMSLTMVSEDSPIVKGADSVVFFTSVAIMVNFQCVRFVVL